jgi:hypothetical protein
MQSPKGRKDFADWIHAQPAKQLSNADAELVLNLTDKPRLDYSTQARAYVHAALAALQSGAPEVAVEQLKTLCRFHERGQDRKPANRLPCSGRPRG